jgi:hypothetical protein
MIAANLERRKTLMQQNSPLKRLRRLETKLTKEVMFMSDESDAEA